MSGSNATKGNSKRARNLIFATVVFLGAIIAFMCSYSAARELVPSVESSVEPPLSEDHEETVHVGNNIPAEERENALRDGEKAGSSLPYGQVKWNLRRGRREDRELSTYELDEKVVKPDGPSGGGAL